MTSLRLTYSECQKEFCGPNTWLEWFCESVFNWNGLQEQMTLKPVEESGFFPLFFFKL